MQRTQWFIKNTPKILEVNIKIYSKPDDIIYVCVMRTVVDLLKQNWAGWPKNKLVGHSHAYNLV